MGHYTGRVLWTYMKNRQCVVVNIETTCGKNLAYAGNSEQMKSLKDGDTISFSASLSRRMQYVGKVLTKVPNKFYMSYPRQVESCIIKIT